MYRPLMPGTIIGAINGMQIAIITAKQCASVTQIDTIHFNVTSPNMQQDISQLILLKFFFYKIQNYTGTRVSAIG